ncbi:MAG: 50S ribosomal protein L13 [Candidatus Lambdaproteobacteria bacterium]|nr:50S ribosomal protein L13 [Candidatus Lambdaproteobacteria bacterium]
MKTVIIRKEDLAPGAQFEPKWLLIDAQDQVLGRLASQVAMLLRGKHKPTFTPHLDTGDFVIVVNADKVKLTGAKLKEKFYYHHTGYPGGIKAARAEKLLADKPTELVRLAVKRMLPKNALNRHILHKLKLYAGDVHPHQAQQPEPYTLPY